MVFLIPFLFTAKALAKDKCQPDFTIPSPPKSLTKVSTDIKKNPVYVFFDGSLSMKGFVVKQPPQDPPGPPGVYSPEWIIQSNF